MTPFTFSEFFTDPILKAPIFATMLMCLAASLIGVLVFVKRQSLLGESLAHATYPGVVIGVLVAAQFLSPSSVWGVSFALGGAFLFSLLGLYAIQWMEKHLRLPGDTALCMVLALFLGGGVTLASRMQLTDPLWYQQIQVFLFGQAVTMEGHHVILYGALATFVLAFILIRFRQIELIHFDQNYAISLGVSMRGCQLMTSLLLISALVIGIRSVGVVLVSGMLIAPAVFARQWTEKLGRMLFIAALFGMVSGFLGIYLSIQLPLAFDSERPLSLPTGPMIVMVASLGAIGALLCSPKKGWLSRMVRRRRFQMQCLSDHLLKILWKHPTVLTQELKKKMSLSSFSLWSLLLLSRRQGWVEGSDVLMLTSEGKRRGARLVRLHRLWELYLRSELKVGEDRVHVSAEEMEHILTADLEEKLTRLLKNPKVDPHKKPIPKREEI